MGTRREINNESLIDWIRRILREIAPNATVHEYRRFVDNGKVITSAGIAAGIDMSLYVVERLVGLDVAEATSRHMEYHLEKP